MEPFQTHIPAPPKTETASRNHAKKYLKKLFDCGLNITHNFPDIIEESKMTKIAQFSLALQQNLREFVHILDPEGHLVRPPQPRFDDSNFKRRK